jgi:hypothetical protein
MASLEGILLHWISWTATLKTLRFALTKKKARSNWHGTLRGSLWSPPNAPMTLDALSILRLRLFGIFPTGRLLSLQLLPLSVHFPFRRDHPVRRCSRSVIFRIVRFGQSFYGHRDAIQVIDEVDRLFVRHLAFFLAPGRFFAAALALRISALAAAALRATSLRCSGVIFAMRPAALFFPPRRPNATAAGSFATELA